MRRFYFVRQTDISGTSGTGAVCEAVLLSDGRVILRWLTYLSSLAVYDSLDDAIAIHGHNGETDIVWIDEEASSPPTETERPPGWTPQDASRHHGVPQVERRVKDDPLLPPWEDRRGKTAP